MIPAGLLLLSLSVPPDGAPPAKDRFARLDGYRIHYQSIGSGKRAVVFLSGWGCDTSLWRNQVPALARYGRLLLVDLPGHGRSDKPDIPYTISLFTRAVNAVLDDAHVEKAAVAGHSMGGMVAYQFAREHPEKTIALIWVDGTFGVPINVDQQIAEFLSRAKEFRSPDYKEKVSGFIDQLFVPATPATVREEVRQSILATPQHVLASCQEGFATRATFEHEVLNVPAFAVFSDFWHPERFMDTFKKYLPRLEYEVLSGVGHYPMLEKPAETNAALARFLAKIQAELR
ncbi:MAG: alpha/beta hydrolase [Bryobacteraceae bacterium]|jgi:pimeloyl-ACP methyl ester carboxylesterase